MKRLDLGRHTLGVCVTIAVLSGCGESQPGALPQSQEIATADGRAAMTSVAKRQNFLYVSDSGAAKAYVYTYPGGTLVGALTGSVTPEGSCADAVGDVYITNWYTQSIVEYAHGGTAPIRTFYDSDGTPYDCSVDPMTGNLALIGPDSIQIFKKARGKPQSYPFSYGNAGNGAYDNSGDLFVDALRYAGCRTSCSTTFIVAELAKGSGKFSAIWQKGVNGAPELGGLQWDGHHLAFGEVKPRVIYRISTNGKLIGQLTLDKSSDVGRFWIQGATLVGPNAGSTTVMLWKYPAGGAPIKTLTGFTQPTAATVSVAK
jgi:hypothetical protein